MKTAKLFKNGRSQAVRLPKEYQFVGMEVAIHREGNRVILEPIDSKAWQDDFFESIRIEDPDFSRAPQGDLPPPVQW